MNPEADASASPSLPTVRARYAVTITTQLFQLFMSAVTASVVPRFLGPTAFGNYFFIFNMSTTLRGMTDLGAQQTFFNCSAQTLRTGALTKAYSLVLLAQLACLLGFFGLTHVFHIQSLIWPGQTSYYIVWVMTLEWLLLVVMSLQQLGDSKGLTIYSQAITGLMAFITSIGLIGLAHRHALHLDSYIYYMGAVTVLAIALQASYLLVYHRGWCWDGSLRERWRHYLERWRTYGTPLAVYSIYVTLFGVADSYLIQRYYGATEQGYFALASKWAALALIFSNAANTIYWREMALAYGSRNHARLVDVYSKFNRCLLFVSIVLAVWLSFNAHFLVHVLAGHPYQGAVIPLAIMAFYPVIQTYGRLNGMTLLATERTRLYRNFGIFWTLPGLACAYFLLAPHQARIPGLNLGAVGIALKMVLFTWISLQCYEMANTRFLKLSYRKLLAVKIRMAVLLGLCGGLAFGGGLSMSRFLTIPQFLVLVSAESFVYFALLLLLAARKPIWIGLQPDDWAYFLDLIRNTMRRARSLSTR